MNSSFNNNYFKYFFITYFFLISYAHAETFVCPDTYQSVSTGFTTEQVRMACGNPANTTTQSSARNVPATIEQWVYTAASSGIPINPNANKQEAQLIISFTNSGTVESVNTQNAAVLTGIPCHDFNQIQVGATKDAVQLQCGPPTSINTIQRMQNESQNVSVWTYNYGQYRPQMIFVFQDDKLTDMQMGQLGK